jgi:hypothetical protein
MFRFRSMIPAAPCAQRARTADAPQYDVLADLPVID